MASTDVIRNDLIKYDQDVKHGINYNVFENKQYSWDHYNSKVGGFNTALKSARVDYVFMPIANVYGYNNFEGFLRDVEKIATLAYTAYENGAKFDSYTNPSQAHLYGENPYSTYMGPQNADEWETFGDVL